MARLWICEGYRGCWICLKKPDYALMSQYAWICINNAEFYRICWHIPEKTAGYARILNVSDAVHSTSRCTNYWVVTQTETYSEHSQTFKMERFAKRMRNERRCAAGHFSGQGRVCRTRALWWRFRQKHKILSISQQGNISKLLLKSYFEWKI